MKAFTGIEELSEAVGTHLGWSGWHTVSQDQVDRFAEATGDHQWIHVDREAAQQGPFGSAIAHGYLTLSLVPMLSLEIYDVQGVALGVNYGTNKVRFPAPLPVGSRVRGGLELLEVTSTPAGYRVVTRVTVEFEGGDKPVCVAEAVSVLVTR